MLGFAEELGLVRGDHIDHVHEFVGNPFGAEQVGAVLVKRAQSHGAKPLLQPGFEHGLLGVGHFYARLRIDKLAQALEQLIRHSGSDSRWVLLVVRSHAVVFMLILPYSCHRFFVRASRFIISPITGKKIRRSMSFFQDRLPRESPPPVQFQFLRFPLHRNRIFGRDSLQTKKNIRMKLYDRSFPRVYGFVIHGLFVLHGIGYPLACKRIAD